MKWKLHDSGREPIELLEDFNKAVAARVCPICNNRASYGSLFSEVTMKFTVWCECPLECGYLPDVYELNRKWIGRR